MLWDTVPSSQLLPWMSAMQDTPSTLRRPPAQAKTASQRWLVPVEPLRAGPRHLLCCGLGVITQLCLQHPPSCRPWGGDGEMPTPWHRHHPCWDSPGNSEIPWRGSCGSTFLILTPAPHRGDEASAPAPPRTPTPTSCPDIVGSGTWNCPRWAPGM